MRYRFLLMLLLFVFACQSKELTSVKVHYQTGRYDLAVENGLAALANEPDNAEVHFYLGLSYAAMDNAALAYDHLAAAAELDAAMTTLVDDNIASIFAGYYNSGLRFIQSGDARAAARSFELAAAADPRDGRAFYQLGRLHLEAGEALQAIDYLDRALDTFDSDARAQDALWLSARARVEAQQVEESIPLLERLLEAAPSRYADAEAVAYDLVELEAWSLAAPLFELSAAARSRVHADDYYTFFNLGVCYSHLTDDEAAASAVVAFERALALRADDPHALLALARACLVAGRWHDAVVHGERYVKSEPHERSAWRILARAYAELGDREKARRCSIRYEALAND